MRVLIAEDERPLAYAIQIKLNESGHDADIVYDGESAMNKLKEGPYDVVLLDIIMPRLNGFEVLEQMKALKLSIPVVMSSNLNNPEDIDKAMDLGAKEYLVKTNLTLNEIVTVLEKHVT